jgi:hypothetical protein
MKKTTKFIKSLTKRVYLKKMDSDIVDVLLNLTVEEVNKS